MARVTERAQVGRAVELMNQRVVNAVVRSAVLANAALDVYPATVTATIAPGPSGLEVTGCPAIDVASLRDRLRAALVNSRFAWPSGLVAVEVETEAPAVLEPCCLDLAIAVAVLKAAEVVPWVPDDVAFLAELRLDGTLRRSRPPEVMALPGLVSHVLVAPGAVRDLTDVTGVTAVGCRDLTRVTRWLRAAEAIVKGGDQP